MSHYFYPGKEEKAKKKKKNQTPKNQQPTKLQSGRPRQQRLYSEAAAQVSVPGGARARRPGGAARSDVST